MFEAMKHYASECKSSALRKLKSLVKMFIFKTFNLNFRRMFLFKHFLRYRLRNTFGWSNKRS